MKYLLSLILLGALVVGAYIYLTPKTAEPEPTPQTPTQTQRVEVIAQNLEIPWDIAFLPDGALLVTERTGHLIKIEKNGTRVEIPIAGVRQGGEGGLLGLVLHPNFESNNYLYLYLSSSQSGENINRVERYVFENNALRDKKEIITNIPGATYHDGGRMEFGPDGKLYITTGDATRPHLAQDKNSLGGKILRLNDDGSIPADNPFGTHVWSYGHRNPQGLAWDAQGTVWETEHGPSGELGLCCRDELNHIEKGANYGWPTVAGDKTGSGLISPIVQSGMDTWAPASLAYLNGSLYFGGLKSETLFEAVLQNGAVAELKEHFVGEFGRIRTVRVGPDQMLYLTTSNLDNRGGASDGDDKIIRINPEAL